MNEDNNDLLEKTVENTTEVKPEMANTEPKVDDKTSKKGKKKRMSVISIIAIIVIILSIITCIVALCLKKDNSNSNGANQETEQSIDENFDGKADIRKEYSMTDNTLQKFDLAFLKLEKGNKNMVYSPLSLKYTLVMLEEGANGVTKNILETVVGNYAGGKYTNSEHLSLANSLFIKDTYKEKIKAEFVNTLVEKYNAEVNYDSFANSSLINDWINRKTFNMIPSLLQDSDMALLESVLVNAVAIDMDWEDYFTADAYTRQRGKEAKVFLYRHVKSNNENVKWGFTHQVPFIIDEMDFKDINNKVAALPVHSVIFNYDVVAAVGEENMRATVEADYRNYLATTAYDGGKNINGKYYIQNGDNISETDSLDEHVKNIVDNYMTDIKKNYNYNSTTTDFKVYVDENVRAFSKNLTKYDGTQLEYVAVMPINEDLESYIANVSVENLNGIMSNLKTLAPENFKPNCVTVIDGMLPKFKFEYELDLENDLKELGLGSVFDKDQADFSNMVEGEYQIEKALHKANIDFNEYGIKAAAATIMGGGGGGGGWDYLYEVPTEFINVTFDKPYMFLIRNKDTGEVWFTGKVYEPVASPFNNGNRY